MAASYLRMAQTADPHCGLCPPHSAVAHATPWCSVTAWNWLKVIGQPTAAKKASHARVACWCASSVSATSRRPSACSQHTSKAAHSHQCMRCLMPTAHPCSQQVGTRAPLPAGARAGLVQCADGPPWGHSGLHLAPAAFHSGGQRAAARREEGEGHSGPAGSRQRCGHQLLRQLRHCGQRERENRSVQHAVWATPWSFLEVSGWACGCGMSSGAVLRPYMVTRPHMGLAARSIFG